MSICSYTHPHALIAEWVNEWAGGEWVSEVTCRFAGSLNVVNVGSSVIATRYIYSYIDRDRDIDRKRYWEKGNSRSLTADQPDDCCLLHSIVNSHTFHAPFEMPRGILSVYLQIDSGPRPHLNLRAGHKYERHYLLGGIVYVYVCVCVFVAEAFWPLRRLTLRLYHHFS